MAASGFTPVSIGGIDRSAELKHSAITSTESLGKLVTGITGARLIERL